MKSERSFSLWKMFLGLVVFLVSVLLLFSVSVDIMTLFDDYRTLQSANLDFVKIVRLDFPAVHNPIGPFGVFFGFWLITLFGKFFSISLLLTFLLLGFFSIFFQNEKNFYWKILCFLIFAFFFNFVMFILRQDSMVHAGYLPWKAFEFMIAVFEKTGTLIISAVIVVTSVIFIFDFRNVKNLFILLFKGIWKLISGIIKLFRSSGKKQTKVKKIKPKKTKEPKVKPEKLVVDPNIVDHNAEPAEISVNEPQQITVKPRPKPVKDTAEDDQLREYIKPDIEDFLNSAKSTRQDMEQIRENIKRA